MHASPGIKQLRILTGTHAGAFLDLGSGTHTLGNADDCDITITDWHVDALSLRVTADGVVVAQWAGANPRGLRFEDLVPVDFEGVVVCIGPCDVKWPADAELLAKLQPPGDDVAFVVPARLSQRLLTGDRRLVSGLVAMMVALVSVGWLVSASSKPRDSGKPTLEISRAALQHTLDGLARGRLTVTTGPNALMVDGLLDSPEQARIIAQAIDAAPAPFPTLRHISVATDVIETIRSAVGLPGAQISYRGAGVFALAVESADVASTQASLDRVAADLAPTVKRIDAILQEPPAAATPMPSVLSTMSTDNVSVMETRDGVKHLVINDPDPTPAINALGLAPSAAAPYTVH